MIFKIVSSIIKISSKNDNKNFCSFFVMKQKCGRMGGIWILNLMFYYINYTPLLNEREVEKEKDEKTKKKEKTKQKMMQWFVSLYSIIL